MSVEFVRPGLDGRRINSYTAAREVCEPVSDHPVAVHLRARDVPRLFSAQAEPLHSKPVFIQQKGFAWLYLPPAKRRIGTENLTNRESSCQRGQNRSRGPDFKACSFTQDQQSQGVIQFGIGEQNAAQRRLAQPGSGMKLGERLNLKADIRCGVQQVPMLASSTHRQTSVPSGAEVQFGQPNTLAQAAGAIPLRITTTCSAP